MSDWERKEELAREIEELEKTKSQDAEDEAFFRRVLANEENPAARAGLKMVEFCSERMKECKSELFRLRQRTLVYGAMSWVNDDDENDNHLTADDCFIDPSKIDEETGFIFHLDGTDLTIRVTASSSGCDDVYVGVLKKESGGLWDDLEPLWQEAGWEKNRSWCWKYCSAAKCLNCEFIEKSFDENRSNDMFDNAQEEIGNMLVEIVNAVTK